MKFVKCKDCILFDKCPSGQRMTALIKDFTRFCPVGEEKQNVKY